MAGRIEVVENCEQSIKNVVREVGNKKMIDFIQTGGGARFRKAFAERNLKFRERERRAEEIKSERGRREDFGEAGVKAGGGGR